MDPSRREVLWVSAAIAAVAAMGPATAAPNATLAAFADAVLPDLGRPGEDLARVLSDPTLPFAKFAPMLAKRLDHRAGGDFAALDRDARVALIRAAIDAGGPLRPLYEGAVFLVGVAFYGGIYEPGGCPDIDYPGPNMGFPDRFFQDAGPWLAPSETPDGNLP
jgi:hypothetical protein